MKKTLLLLTFILTGCFQQYSYEYLEPRTEFNVNTPLHGPSLKKIGNKVINLYFKNDFNGRTDLYINAYSEKRGGKVHVERVSIVGKNHSEEFILNQEIFLEKEVKIKNSSSIYEGHAIVKNLKTDKLLGAAEDNQMKVKIFFKEETTPLIFDIKKDEARMIIPPT